jgi:hypothetical protein
MGVVSTRRTVQQVYSRLLYSINTSKILFRPLNTGIARVVVFRCASIKSMLRRVREATHDRWTRDVAEHVIVPLAMIVSKILINAGRGPKRDRGTGAFITGFLPPERRRWRRVWQV